MIKMAAARMLTLAKCTHFDESNCMATQYVYDYKFKIELHSHYMWYA